MTPLDIQNPRTYIRSGFLPIQRGTGRSGSVARVADQGTGMAVKLGEMLLKAGLIDQDQLTEALESQKKNGEKLGFNLVQLGYVQEDDITQLLSEQYGVPSINLRHFEIEESVINLIPSEVAQKYLVVPVNRTGATLTISMADPTNVFAMDDIKFMTGYNVEPVVASEIAIREAIDKYYGSSHAMELKKVMDEMAEAEASLIATHPQRFRREKKIKR